MQLKGISSGLIEFRSIEDTELAGIQKHHKHEFRLELSEFLDFDLPWAPLSQAKLKTKVEEMHKEDRSTLFSIWSKNNEFVGLGHFTASWDPWCPFINVIIWPEFRRKCYGREAAKLLLEAAFEYSIAHVAECSVPEWNHAGIAFAESLGFKRAGVGRRAGVINGKFFDRLFFDLLRDEYLAAQTKKAGD